MVEKQYMKHVRYWLDWNKPALPGAVDWLVERYRKVRNWDLSRVIIVTPGARSRGRLLELMVERSEIERMNFSPPDFTPLGQLPERLYPAQHEFAGDIAQLIAWSRALQSIDGEQLRILVKNVPSADQLANWLPLARLLKSLHIDLSSEGLAFGDVARAANIMYVARRERDRWELLEQIQRVYYDQLKAVGLWDLQAARITAVRKRECHSAKDIVLMGMADMSQIFRQMLEQIGERVSALVFASDSVREGFDELGCLRSEFWSDYPVAVRDEHLCIVDRPADQASAVIDAIERLGGQLPASQIAIGVPDRSVVSHVRRTLELAGLTSRDAAGKLLDQTLPIRLVTAVADYLRHQRFAPYCRLIRHPDLFDLVSSRIGHHDWLEDVDAYQNEFIPGEFLLRAGFHLAQEPKLTHVHRIVQELLEPLSGHTRPMGEWVEAWMGLLLQVYGQREIGSIEANREILASCQALQAALRPLVDLPAEWSFDGSAVEALETILHHVGHESVAEPPTADAIELLGWLDLPLDDAAATIVTGMNDGVVPSTESGHLFLPNTLREKLEIQDNARRYARDAYALSLLAHSPRRLVLISGRHGIDGDPLLPSRLLFAVDDGRMARRANDFFRHAGDVYPRIWLASALDVPAAQQFSIPEPRTEGLKLSSLGVTNFKQYLQCPYRFYLGRVLKLEEFSDDLAELPAFAFGHLLHRVVEAFGKDPLKDSTDAEAIRQFFRRQLEREMVRHGDHPSPAVRIQHQQIRLRLDRLADLQARRRSEGWEIVEAELEDCAATLVVDGEPFMIHGRIDRVDRHVDTGKIAVFDYKTFEPASSPEKTHRVRGAWVDLQLPLYRHLIRTRPYSTDEPIELGYILLPGDLKKTAFVTAEWTEEDLRSADEAAFKVIRAVRGNRFWPPTDPPPVYSQTWSAICQDAVFERWSVGEAVR